VIVKDLKDFERFYEDELRAVLERIDAVRLRNIAYRFLSFLIAVAVIVAVEKSLFLWGNHVLPELAFWILVLVVPIVCLGLKGLLFRGKYGDVDQMYAEEAIGGLLRFIAPPLFLAPWDNLSLDVFLHSRLCNQRVDNFSGSHLIYGRLGWTDVWFSQIHAQRREEVVTRDKDGHIYIDEYWVTVFRGILFVADFNKDFSSVVILRSRKRGFFNDIRGRLFRSSEEIVMENPEFNRFFTVYADDPIEVRYILTPTLMERLVQLRKRANRNIDISFVPPYMYLAMPYETLFQTPVFGSVVNRKTMLKYFLFLSFFASIPASLDLDTRIWSKQPQGEWTAV